MIRPLRSRCQMAGLGQALMPAVLSLAMCPTVHAKPAKSGVCSVRDRSESVVVMVCQADSVPAQWQAAATATCGSRKYCNVWVWTDAASAPEKAPLADSGLSKDKAARAKAVWAHDSRSLMLIGQRR